MGWRLLLNSTAVRLRALEILNETRPVLDNAEDLRSVATQYADEDARIRAWADLRAESLGIQQRVVQWSDWGTLLAGLTFVVFVSAIAIGLASVALPEDRRINAGAALIGLLGMPTLALLFWILSFVTPFSAILGGMFGWLARLAMRWKSSNDYVAASLAKACTLTLRETCLGPWFFGQVIHLLWLVALALAIAVTWLTFMFQSYRFGWETTVLSQDFFTDLVQVSGFWAPLVDTELPAPSEIGAGWASESAKAAWARWLVGCLLVWALLPRLFAWLLNNLVWHRRAPLLDQVPRERSFVKDLCERFQEWDRQAQRDAQAVTTGSAVGIASATACEGSRVAAIGWELPNALGWPWQGHLFPWIWVEQLPGSLSDREGVIDKVLRSSISTVVLVVSGARTPDLGVERLILGLQRQRCRVVIFPVGEDQSQRWKRWRDARRLVSVDQVGLSELGKLFAER